MSYTEEKSAANGYRRTYADDLARLVEQRQQQAAAKRAAYAQNIFTDPEPYREQFKRMLGWPLVDHQPEALPAPQSELLAAEDGYHLYRMQFEVLPGLHMHGLLYRADGDDQKPLVLVQHGGNGTPEFIGNLFGEGTANYNDMLQRVKKHGVHIFAPQLLLWEESYEVPYNRQDLDIRLKRVGGSITAVEVYGLQRILDYFEAQPYVSCFGMVGLSYGGFYTLFTTAIDTRIRSAVSCAYFNTRDKVPWVDWTWFGAAETFDDAEVACLVYPRRLCLEIADHDELFDHQYGVQSFETVKRLCHEVGTDWIKLIVFDGCHEFCHDDAPIEQLIADLQAN